MVPVIIHRLAGGGGDHLIFERTKGGSVLTENPKGGIAENFGRSQRGKPLKFAWKMKTCGGGGIGESHQKLLGGITSVM